MLKHDPFKRLMALKPPADYAQFPQWWQQACAELSLVAGYNFDPDTDTMTVPDTTDLESRPSEPLGTVLQYIGAAGTGSAKLIPVVKLGNFGCVIEPSPLSAADAGSDVTLTISASTPQFPFGTLNVSGATITGLSYSTFYYVYLTNFSYDDGSYTAALATTLAKNMQVEGYFCIGSITTPAAAAPPSGGGGGGGYIPPGGDLVP